MLNLISLFSSSKGNCTYVFSRTTKILVDIGVSAKRLTECLISKEINPEEINAVFLHPKPLIRKNMIGAPAQLDADDMVFAMGCIPSGFMGMITHNIFDLLDPHIRKKHFFSPFLPFIITNPPKIANIISLFYKFSLSSIVFSSLFSTIEA